VPSVTGRTSGKRRKGSQSRSGHRATVTVDDFEEEKETEHLKPVVFDAGDWRENQLDDADGVDECDDARGSHGAPDCAPHQL